MSGGFFRGTSADQDTRFSNKQAKLLKSQKFASELDHLVDMSKVKMDVMMPWIANRVTELLGFEDEVLINFIYGLLDGKEVNGKEVQISLTGFMEKNTGKFMKELWTLLLSAQGNASGVPQQLLDAKEELTRKNKAERERIANEIQKKKEKEKEKEGRELEQEKMRKMDGEVENLRANDTGLEPNSKHPSGDSSVRLVDEKQTNERNGSRGKSRVSRSPHLANNSPSSPRGTPSRSISKSFSNSRSYSGERHRSRSTSGSPQPRGHPISAGRVHRSPSRRSVTPRRRRSPCRSLSPWARGSSRSRRRSTSHSRRRSPSPVRRRVRSPLRRGSRSPRRYRSRSPMQHRLRSPIRRRSRSPIRHRSRSAPRRRSPLGRRGSPSPIWHRSPSPLRRRSPSPVRRRPPSIVRRRSPSPMRRKSPSPVRRRYRRSPSTPWRRSPSPVRHRSRRSITPRRRSPSPKEWSSGSPIQPASLSPARRVSPKRRRRSPVQSPGERTWGPEKVSPIRHATPRDQIKHSVEAHKAPNSGRQPHSSRSPRRDPRYRYGLRKKLSSLSPSPYKSPSLSKSPPRSRRKSPIEDKRLSSPDESPVKQTREPMHHISSPSPRMGRQHKPRDHSPAPSGEDEETNYAREPRFPKPKASEKRSPPTGEHKETLEKLHYQDEYSTERLASERPSESRSHIDSLKLRKIDSETKSDRTLLHPEVRYKSNEKTHSRNSNDGKGSISRHRLENAAKSSRKVEPTNQSGSLESDSGESNKHRAAVNEKRKHKRSERQEVASDDDYSTDSQIEERKEAKRRRKEEKRFRKDERRRRREERRRRREERRAEKLKKKSVDASPPSDFERDRDDYASDPEHIARRKSHASDTEETESEQKKLEIELRRKALESLRAKKGVGH